MKELYLAPEAEILRFVAEEKLAFDEASDVSWDVANTQDGDWSNTDKWFGK